MYEPICGYGSPIRKNHLGPSVRRLQSGNISFTVGRKTSVKSDGTEDIPFFTRRLDSGHRPVPGWYRPSGLRPEAGTQTGRPAETGPAGRRLGPGRPQQPGGQVQDAQQERHSAARAGEQQLHHCEGRRAAVTKNAMRG